MGRTPPDFPTIFAKYRSSLIGRHDDIVLPPESDVRRLGGRAGR
jgi:acylpyruvate hydrolase